MPTVLSELERLIDLRLLAGSHVGTEMCSHPFPPTTNDINTLLFLSRKNLQLSFLGTRHTGGGVNYARFMEEFSLKEAEGYFVTASQLVQRSILRATKAPSLSTQVRIFPRREVTAPSFLLVLLLVPS
ncbi:hypothetical protein OSB04_018136 [Centaurea solstitialis]|uniref:Uncharacterized protein n=1 Tax=Centaurea solstitialis TaxID=347529 RepID=A0AA38WMP5_9ASTR|nr:hypothetical protein OSB04_018136 [Centaurea solstitialis]